MTEDAETLPAAESEAAELQPGTEISGFIVAEKIGQGGMGKVYGAHHPRIGKRVAIKVLERSYCNDAQAVARFEQEARLVNEIRHPNIVDVFQFGELPDKRSFFVMEWLTGETLTARIDQSPLETRDAVEILDAICDALEAAHEHGVVHRDLKSDNVFLASSRGKRTVKLLDFGIAKLAGRTDLSTVGKTASGMIVGTPGYMSPEQARGQTVGPRTDVYQLGVLTYKMLTGKLPFDAENPFELIVAQLKAPPPSPKKLAPKTPDVLARLVVQMMAKTPDERPSVAEVRALGAELLGAPAAARAPRRMTSVLVGMALFLAGVISLGVFFWVRNANHDDTAPPVAPAALPAVTQPAPTAVTPTPPAPTPPAPTPPEPTLPAVVTTPDPAPVAPPPATPPPEIQMDPTKVKKHTKHAAADDDVAQDEATPTGPGAILFRLEIESTIEIDGDVVATSSRGGRFEVPAGDHLIHVEAPGRQSVTRSVDVPAGGVTILSIEDDLSGTEP